MSEENTIFQNGEVAVSTTRFVVGAQTFAMHGITSVKGIEIRGSYFWPAMVVLLGFFITLDVIGGSLIVGILGGLIMAAGVWLAIRRKPKFAVVLSTASGEITAYKSGNHEHIGQILQALNDAIIARG